MFTPLEQSRRLFAGRSVLVRSPAFAGAGFLIDACIFCHETVVATDKFGSIPVRWNASLGRHVQKSPRIVAALQLSTLVTTRVAQ